MSVRDTSARMAAVIGWGVLVSSRASTRLVSVTVRYKEACKAQNRKSRWRRKKAKILRETRKSGVLHVPTRDCIVLYH